MTTNDADKEEGEGGSGSGSGSRRGEAWNRLEAARRAAVGGGKGGTPGAVVESDAIWNRTEREY